MAPDEKLPRPRKSAKQSRSLSTVTDIIEGAARILEDRGFAGYNTNAIAERAGVSIGSLYQYFPSKDAITIALIGRETEQLLADVAKAECSENWVDGLRAMIEAAVTHELHRPKLSLLLDQEEERFVLEEREKRVSTAILQALRTLLTSSSLKFEGSLDVASRDLLAITRGLLDSRDGSEPELQEWRRRIHRAVFGYLRFSRQERQSFDL
jgi:AcrR family transcriptional regulator